MRRNLCILQQLSIVTGFIVIDRTLNLHSAKIKKYGLGQFYQQASVPFSEQCIFRPKFAPFKLLSFIAEKHSRGRRYNTNACQIPGNPTYRVRSRIREPRALSEPPPRLATRIVGVFLRVLRKHRQLDSGSKHPGRKRPTPAIRGTY